MSTALFPWHHPWMSSLRNRPSLIKWPADNKLTSPSYKRRLPLISAINALSFAAEEKLVVDEDDINLEVLGHSGKIALRSKKFGQNVQVTFDYIRELDESNAIIGENGRRKHSINSFARESFTFKLKFCGDSDGDVCKAGSLYEKGKKIELGIEIKGRQKPRDKLEKRGKGKHMKTLDLGGADCTLSGQLKKNGMYWEEMEHGFPLVNATDKKTLFIFRFPRFSKSVFYDPTLDFNISGAFSLAKSHVALISCALFVIMKLFV
eukprot:gene19849-21791_t